MNKYDLQHTVAKQLVNILNVEYYQNTNKNGISYYTVIIAILPLVVSTANKSLFPIFLLVSFRKIY